MELKSDTLIDENLRQRVIDAICERLPASLGREVPDLSADTRLAELTLSSAGTLEVLLMLEDTLDIEVDVEDFAEADMETIGRLATYVAGHSVTA